MMDADGRPPRFSARTAPVEEPGDTDFATKQYIRPESAEEDAPTLMRKQPDLAPASAGRPARDTEVDSEFTMPERFRPTAPRSAEVEAAIASLDMELDEDSILLLQKKSDASAMRAARASDVTTAPRDAVGASGAVTAPRAARDSDGAITAPRDVVSPEMTGEFVPAPGPSPRRMLTGSDTEADLRESLPLRPEVTAGEPVTVPGALRSGADGQYRDGPKISGGALFAKVPTDGRRGRETMPTRRKGRKRSMSLPVLVVVSIFVAGAVAGGVWMLLSRLDRGNAVAVPLDASTPVAAVQADAAQAAVPLDAAPVGPCEGEMVRVEREPRSGSSDGVNVCIDKLEVAGDDGLPIVDILFADAEKACEQRGMRLCTKAEWVAACRGGEEGKTSFPYAWSYRPGLCNANPSKSGKIDKPGSYPDCVSTSGAMDMSGNVSEWTADGYARGGSAVDGSDGKCSQGYRKSRDRTYDDIGYRCCKDPRQMAGEAPDSPANAPD
jgi:hypothetical protein